mmetsp:Transcript_17628/g.38204  ORF Transcript_17628/g.38204 Transcript_17628/m.38204 type:complete len:379 (-) Transcript_17628:282-1418(-)
MRSVISFTLRPAFPLDFFMESARLREYSFFPLSFVAPLTPSNTPNVLPVKKPASSPPQDTFSGWAFMDSAPSSDRVLNSSFASAAGDFSSSSFDSTWNAFIISPMFKVGRALVSAPQMTSRKSESETSAFCSFGAASTATTFFMSGVLVVCGGMKDVNVFRKRPFNPSTQTFSSNSTSVSSSTAGSGSFFSIFSTLGLPLAPKLNCENMFVVRSSASSINVSASSIASFPLTNPKLEKNPPLFFGGASSTLSAMAMASSASAMTESSSLRKSSLLAISWRSASCSVLVLGSGSLTASLSASADLPPPPKKAPKNPPLLPSPSSCSFLRCSRRLRRSSLLASLSSSPDGWLVAADEEASTVGKVAVGFSHVLSPETLLK